MSNQDFDFGKVREVFSHPYNMYGGPLPQYIDEDHEPYAQPQQLHQETTQYVTIKPKTTSKVTIRDPIDRTRETAQTTTTQRSFTSGGSYNYDHDHDGDHEHDYHRRRRRWYYPNLYYSPYAWMDSYYPVYPYDPTMNPIVREALNYKCMWDPDSNPELCDRVFASEIIRSNPWYNPWGWGFPSWRWY